MLKFERALVLCAHPDDEFGCSGTLRRLIEEGTDVHYMAFSMCEKSVPAGFPQDVLKHEVLDATSVIGIKRENVRLYDFEVRIFPTIRQEILELLVKTRNELKPDVVFLPAMSDIHQDHATVAREGLRAFKHQTVLGYELPMNTLAFANAAYVTLTREQVDRKIESLAQYRSQSFRPYATAEFIAGLAKVRGVQCNAEYAECFEAVRIKI